MNPNPKPETEIIAQEIARLREAKTKITQFNAAEDDNHQAIDAQIMVLEREAQLLARIHEQIPKERWEEVRSDPAWKMNKDFAPVDEDAIAALMDKLPFYVTDAMVRAREWLDGEMERDGEYETALSSEWQEITEPAE